MPAGLVALATIVALGGIAASCGGMCAEVRALRDADPDWQHGSLPAIGTAFIGNEVAEMAANAWVVSVNETIVDIVRGIPVVGPALTSAGNLTVTVDNTSFEAPRTGDGVSIVFDIVLEATPAARAIGIPIPIPGELRRMAQVSVRLRVQAPIEIDASTADRSTLIANLDAVRLSAVSVELGPLGGGVDPSVLLDPIQQRLLRGRQLVLAEMEPLAVSAAQLRMRPIRARHSTSTHFAVDVEFPDVAAPADVEGVASIGEMPGDALILALPESSAMALGDFGLRVIGANGFNQRGERGGPYAARLRDLAVDGDQVELTMDALRCNRPCASARILASIRTVGADDNFRVEIERTEVLSASLPRPLVATALPGAQVLSERATAVTREVLLSEPMRIPMLPSHQIVVQELGARNGVIMGVARLQPSGATQQGENR